MKPCALHYYQLLFDLRRGVRENFMKAQGVRVHRKVKNHWRRTFLEGTMLLNLTLLLTEKKMIVLIHNEQLKNCKTKLF